MYDILIIGGGAAGLSAAIHAKKANPALRVAISEQLERVGKKISVTGNGRCNISNRDMHISHFYSGQKAMVDAVLSAYTTSQTKQFFESIGIELTQSGDKLYPYSLQAASVVDALRFAAAQLNVETLTGSRVTTVKNNGSFFAVLTETETFNAKCVLVACGGLAGGAKLGSTGDGYAFLKSFGHHITSLLPAIVQVKTDNTITRQLKGIKVMCGVSVQTSGAVLVDKTDYGEVLFCDYGLSGPPVLQLSRFCKLGCTIVLDLLPEYTLPEVVSLLEKRQAIFAQVPLSDFFAGWIHKKLGQVVLKACSLNLTTTAATLRQSDCSAIAGVLKAFTFQVTGNTGFPQAQTTSGGACLDEFSPNTLMSEKCAGLFAAGEVLDVDGDCGGYNLQWAWSSAYVAAIGCVQYLSENKND